MSPTRISVNLGLFEDDANIYETNQRQGYVLGKLQRGLSSL
jgi:hypothetical protein